MNKGWNVLQGSTKRFDLGATAASDLENGLSQDAFSVGMKTTLESFEDFMSIAGTGQKLHVTFESP
jgi:hypothetical protein